MSQGSGYLSPTSSRPTSPTFSLTRTLPDRGGHSKAVTKLTIHKGLLISSSDDGAIKIRNSQNYEPIQSLDLFSAGCRCMRVTNCTLFACTTDHTVRAWRFNKPRGTVQSTPSSAETSPTASGSSTSSSRRPSVIGKPVVSTMKDKLATKLSSPLMMMDPSVGMDSEATQFLNIPTCETLLNHTHKANCFILLPPSGGGTMESGSRSRAGTVMEGRGRSGSGTSLISPKDNSSFLLICGCEDGGVKVWNIEKKEAPLFAFEGSHTRSIECIEPIGNDTFVTGGKDKDVRVWNIKTRKCVKVMKKHTDPITALVVNREKDLIVSSGAEGNIIIWSIKAGEPTHSLLHNPRIPVRSLSHQPSTGLLFSGGSDGCIKLWDILTGICVGNLEPKSCGAVNAMCVDEQNHFLILGCEDAAIRSVDLNTFASERGLTVEETQRLREQFHEQIRSIQDSAWEKIRILQEQLEEHHSEAAEEDHKEMKKQLERFLESQKAMHEKEMLEEELENLKDDKHDLESQVSHLTSTNSDLTQQLQQSTKTNKTLGIQLSEAEARELKQNAAFVELCEKSERDEREYQTKFHVLEERIRELTEVMTHACKERDEHKAHAETLQTQIQELQQDSAQQDIRLAKAMGALKIMVPQMDALKQEVAEYKSKWETALFESSEHKAAFESEAESLRQVEEQHDTLKAHINKLQTLQEQTAQSFHDRIQALEGLLQKERGLLEISKEEENGLRERCMLLEREHELILAHLAQIAECDAVPSQTSHTTPMTPEPHQHRQPLSPIPIRPRSRQSSTVVSGRTISASPFASHEPPSSDTFEAENTSTWSESEIGTPKDSRDNSGEREGPVALLFKVKMNQDAWKLNCEKLEGEVQTLSATVSTLSEENSSLKSEVLRAQENLSETEKQMETERKDLSEKLQAAELESQTLKETKTELELTLSQTKRDFEKMEKDSQQRFSEMQNEFSELSKQHDVLQQSNNELISKLQSVEGQLSEEQVVNRQLAETKDRLEKNLKDANQKIEQFGSANETTEKLSADLRESLSEATKNLAEMRSENERMCEAWRVAEERIQGLVGMVEKLKMEKSELEQQVQGLVTKSADLENQLIETRTLSEASSNSQLEQLKCQLQTTLSEKSKMESEISRLEDQVLCLSEERNGLKEHVSILENSLCDLTARAAFSEQTEREASELRVQVQELQSEMENEKKELENVQCEKEEQVVQLLAENHILHETIMQLEAAQMESLQRMQLAQKKQAELIEKLSVLENTNHGLEDHVTSDEKQLSVLQEKLKKSEEGRDRQSEQIKTFEGQVQKMERERAELSQALRDISAVNFKLEMDLDQKSQMLHENEMETTSLKAKLCSLSLEVESVKASEESKARLEQLLAEKQSDVDRLQACIALLEREHAEAIETLKNSQSVASELEQECERLKTKCEIADTENRRLLRLTARLPKDACDQCVQLVAENEKIISQLSELALYLQNPDSPTQTSNQRFTELEDLNFALNTIKLMFKAIRQEVQAHKATIEFLSEQLRVSEQQVSQHRMALLSAQEQCSTLSDQTMLFQPENNRSSRKQLLPPSSSQELSTLPLTPSRHHAFPPLLSTPRQDPQSPHVEITEHVSALVGRMQFSASKVSQLQTALSSMLDQEGGSGGSVIAASSESEIADLKAKLLVANEEVETAQKLMNDLQLCLTMKENVAQRLAEQQHQQGCIIS